MAPRHAVVNLAFGYFERAYVINLDREADRLAKMSARLARIGVPFERFAAVQARADERLFPDKPQLTPGYFACARSGNASGSILECAGKAGEVLRMKVPHGEGLASHTSSESCVGGRKAVGEALTGVRAGWVLSPEIDASWVPTRFKTSEGHTGRAASARFVRTRRDRRPHARTQAPCTEAGRSHGRPDWARAGNPKGAQRR